MEKTFQDFVQEFEREKKIDISDFKKICPKLSKLPESEFSFIFERDDEITKEFFCFTMENFRSFGISAYYDLSYFFRKNLSKFNCVKTFNAVIEEDKIFSNSQNHFIDFERFLNDIIPSFNYLEVVPFTINKFFFVFMKNNIARIISASCERNNYSYAENLKNIYLVIEEDMTVIEKADFAKNFIQKCFVYISGYFEKNFEDLFLTLDQLIFGYETHEEGFVRKGFDLNHPIHQEIYEKFKSENHKDQIKIIKIFSNNYCFLKFLKNNYVNEMKKIINTQKDVEIMISRDFEFNSNQTYNFLKVLKRFNSCLKKFEDKYEDYEFEDFKFDYGESRVDVIFSGSYDDYFIPFRK